MTTAEQPNEVVPTLARAEGESWCVCHTKARCEKKFADLLRAEGMLYYLPLVGSVRRYGTQTKRFTKPLFTGYVFARVPNERRSRIFQQDLLARVLPVENEDRFLHQLEDVRRIIASGLETLLHPLLRRGTRVKVVSGPLRGVEGIIDDPKNPQGIVLSIDVLQQGLLVKVPGGDLKPLP